MLSCIHYAYRNNVEGVMITNIKYGCARLFRWKVIITLFGRWEYGERKECVVLELCYVSLSVVKANALSLPISGIFLWVFQHAGHRSLWVGNKESSLSWSTRLMLSLIRRWATAFVLLTCETGILPSVDIFIGRVFPIYIWSVTSH